MADSEDAGGMPQILRAGREDWTQSLIDEPFEGEVRLRDALTDLGLPGDLIAADVEAYSHEVEHLKLPLVPEGIHFRGIDARADYGARKWSERQERFDNFVKELLGKRKYLLESSELIVQDVPLFWLTCPAVKRSHVKYKDEETNTIGASWTVKVLGSGMGANETLSIMDSAEFEAGSGEYKLIFLRVPLRVFLVGTYENENLISKSLRTEVPEDYGTAYPQMGIASKSEAESMAAYRNARRARPIPYPLAGDHSRGTATIQHSYAEGGEFEYSAGVDAFGLKTTSKAKVGRKKKTTLTFTLPAGADYSLERDENGSGIWWR